MRSDNRSPVFRHLHDPSFHPGLAGRNLVAVLLLISIVCIIYSNTYDCSWHFDDYRNIVGNSRLQITDLSLESIKQTFYAHHDSERLYRPLPMLSFALNWYHGQGSLFGFHVVNTLIHCLNAGLLFLTLLAVLDTPMARRQKTTNAYFVALLGALLWAVNPVQTQTVTYIVQRMAAMAALFYLSGLFFYLKCRMTQSIRYRIVFGILCLLSCLAGVLSKENALMLPLSIGLMEFIFFPHARQFLSARPNLRTIFVACMIAGIGIALVLSFDAVSHTVVHSYENRPFTLMERLLTQPRILVFYLSLIFFPLPSRLSIGHVINTSHSLIDPVTTIPSMVVIITCIGFAIFNLKRKPFVAFGLLFFFLNHVIESSVLGLELVYEHRNYLPTLFLFLPVAHFGCQLIASSLEKQRLLHVAWISLFILVICALGLATHARNVVWKTEKSLWQNVLDNYPDSTRALHNLADQHYAKIGDYTTALKLYAHALSLDWRDNSTIFRKGITLNNVAAIYYGFGMDEKALQFWNSALQVMPTNIKAIQGKAQVLTSLGRFDQALQTLDTVPDDSKNADIYNLQALLLATRGDYSTALGSCRKAMRLMPFNSDSLLCLASIFTRMQLYDKSEFFLKLEYLKNTNTIKVLLMSLENAILRNDTQTADKIASALLDAYPPDEILSNLRLSQRHETIPLAVHLVGPHLRAAKGTMHDRWIVALDSMIDKATP